MSLMLARRGRCVFRQVNLRETLPISTRVSLIPNHVRRVAQIASSRPSHLITAANLSKRILARAQINSYATAAGRPKAHTGKAKATKRSSSASKPAKETGSRTKAKAPKPKKELSPKAKEKLEAKKRREEIRELKEVALKEPKGLPATPIAIFLSEKLKQPGKGPVTEKFREASSEYRSWTADELEPYKRQADANRAANAAAYEAWVKSHTPLQIRQANLARKRLAKLSESSSRSIKLAPIRDDRQVKGPQTSFLIYSQERYGSGDLKHMSISDAGRRVAEEWKGLTDQEKEKYKRLQQEDTERYIREYRAAYGEDPSMVKESSAEP